MSDEDPLQLEEDCGELGDHPPDGEKDPGALLGSLDEAWDEPSLEASDDEASVDDAIDVALNDMDGAAPSPNGDPTHVDVPTQMPGEIASLHRSRNQAAAKVYQALPQWCSQRGPSH